MARKKGKSSTPEPTATGIPQAAIAWVRDVFRSANDLVSGTLSRIPTHHEPELDMQLISALNQAPAVADVSGWTVYIQTHFLGGRRHFYNWEVADIGFLVIFRDREKVVRVKVGLLQSKRLYALEAKALPDTKERFRIGFASLVDDPESFRQLAAGRTFTFSEESKYLAILNKENQQSVLRAYQQQSGIPAYYLLYNPVDVPWSASLPATSLKPLPSNEVGCRVMRSSDLTKSLEHLPQGYKPSLGDVRAVEGDFVGPHRGGWSLEHFVADRLVSCREGYVATSDTDPVLENLFFNRTGPISAAIAITIEAPPGVQLLLPDSA